MARTYSTEAPGRTCQLRFGQALIEAAVSVLPRAVGTTPRYGPAGAISKAGRVRIEQLRRSTLFTASHAEVSPNRCVGVDVGIRPITPAEARAALECVEAVRVRTGETARCGGVSGALDEAFVGGTGGVVPRAVGAAGAERVLAQALRSAVWALRLKYR